MAEGTRIWQAGGEVGDNKISRCCQKFKVKITLIQCFFMLAAVLYWAYQQGIRVASILLSRAPQGASTCVHIRKRHQAQNASVALVVVVVVVQWLSTYFRNQRQGMALTPLNLDA